MAIVREIMERTPLVAGLLLFVCKCVAAGNYGQWQVMNALASYVVFLKMVP